MDLGSVGGFIEHVGLPVAMLFAFGWWIVRKDEQARTDAKEATEQHRQEHIEARTAFLESLDKVTGRIEENTKSVDELAVEVRARRSA